MTAAPLAKRHPTRPIEELLADVPVEASRADRHLWLIEVLEWIRQGEPITGMQYVLRRLDDAHDAREQVLAFLGVCLNDMHLSSLLADLGFAPRPALLSELGERLRNRMLPASPDTRDLAILFGLLLHVQHDHTWVARLDSATLSRLGRLLNEAWLRTTQGSWRPVFMSALSILAGQVKATGLSRELRLRMGDGKEITQTFIQLGRAVEDLHDLLDEETSDQVALLQQAQYLRALIDRCVNLTQEIHAHLEAYGVSVDVVFQIDQIRARCKRMEQVLDCLLSPTPHDAIHHLTLALLHQGNARQSVRALFRQHYSLLSRLVAERNAETGEHYITRTRAEYMSMLSRAGGGGLVLAGTTFIKLAIVGLGLSAFWSGFAVGANYAISFVVIFLLGWTVATKQPAMTAPAMAARLHNNRTPEDVAGFTDEVVHLIRSQMAGILGNLVVVAPVVLLVQALSWWAWGQPIIDAEQAKHVLKDLTLLGPTAFYAAFTGVLLFASSLIAGWFENWFVWHRLDSAMQWHPGMRRVLGPARATRWAQWWRTHVSSLAANVSLGLLLGITPVLAAFFGLPLEVRHVTLSTGQLAAALGTLGVSALHDANFWWCVAAIPVTGILNVGVSFVMALRVALRSREVRVNARDQLTRALLQRMRREPLRFFLPPKQ